MRYPEIVIVNSYLYRADAGLVGQGFAKRRAEERVGHLFGVSGYAVRTWGARDLLTFFKKEEIASTIETARAAGRLFSVKQDDPDYGEPSKGRNENIPADLWVIWDQFEDNYINDVAL